ncbi:MAG: LysR family transcriptional regulator substrate-binding protein [Pseudonocardiaceae bacterium]
MTLTACQRAGFQPRFAIEGGEMDAVLSFVEAGLGVAVVPSMVLPSRPKLRGVPFVPPTPVRTIALAHRTDVRPTRAAEEFRCTLLQLLSSAHTHGNLPAGVEFIAPGGPFSQSGPGSTSVGQLSGPSSSRTTRQANPSE